jgi:predicted metal-binding membrane protein
VLLAWAYLLSGAAMKMSTWDMTSLDMALGLKITNMAMATPMAWTPAYAFLMLAMWWVMMIAMMLPSAAPMILLFARVQKRQEEKTGRLVPAACFAWGYIGAWGVFSLLAVALQWAFERCGLLSPMMMNTTSALLAAVILIAAGLYQLTPLKQACLRHCRSPIQFLSQHWRKGKGGAFVMGLHHGAFCLGCCWGLMVLLFFGGVMNLYWIVGLAVVVLIEKLSPFGRIFGYVTGTLLILWGVSFLYQAFV